MVRDARHLTVAVLVVWFVLALVGSLLGVFNSAPNPPILLGLAVVVPVALFGLGYLAWPGFRQFVSSLDLRVLTWAKTWRVVWVVRINLQHDKSSIQGCFQAFLRLRRCRFIAMSHRRRVPHSIPTRTLTGRLRTSCGLGGHCHWPHGTRGGLVLEAPLSYKTFVVWNVLGIVDLVLAVSLGVLASPTPVGILAGDVTTRLMAMFPLSLIPTFLVPLFLIFHLICLSRVRKA